MMERVWGVLKICVCILAEIIEIYLCYIHVFLTHFFRCSLYVSLRLFPVLWPSSLLFSMFRSVSVMLLDILTIFLRKRLNLVL